MPLRPNDSGHATFSPASTSMAPSKQLNMDEVARNRMLKQYRTQAASAASTLLATLSVVRYIYPLYVKEYNDWRIWANRLFFIMSCLADPTRKS